MKKINQISALRNDYGFRNDLFTRYRKQMEILLSTNRIIYSKREKELYLPDEHMESKLKEVLEDEIDSLSTLIGYGGIGKSTVLRNYFYYYNSEPELIENNKVVIFPSLYNNNVVGCDEQCRDDKCKTKLAEEIKEELACRIDSVCSLLEEKYRELKIKFDSEQGQQKFYLLLKETDPKALEHVPYNLRRNLDIEEENKLKLDYAYEKERFSCAVAKLKYYLSSNLCPCKKIIIILDDIESLPFEYQVQLIMQYLRFYERMKNDAITMGEKKYLVNIIISMRPHTYSILTGYKAFTAYSVTRNILKRDMVDLNAYFNEKLNYYSRNVEVKDLGAWKEARLIMTRLSSKFNNKYANMIKNICLWNTREAMRAYTTILTNRIWIQRDMTKTSGFTIKEDDYIFNNITVIRALACEQYYVYAKRGSYWIPNLLQNTADRNFSFINLCICNCFSKDKNKDYTYGEESKSFGEIKNYFMISFPEYKDLSEAVDGRVRYLFEQRVLQKSINDIDVPITVGKSESLSDQSLLYLTPKGYELLRMMESDSVYMELCREDYYRDYDNNTELNRESSFELMQKGQQINIFYDLFLFLYELLEEEEKYINYAIEHQTIDSYINFFGNEIMCERLYKGIWRSIDFSGNKDNEFIKPVMERVSKKLDEIRNRLEEPYGKH